jgi:hypothetical protein
MRRNRIAGLTYQLGVFDAEKSKWHIIATYYKKTRLLLRANLMFQRKRKILLRVSYSKYKDAWGKKRMFNNECFCGSLEEMREYLSLFTEKSLVDYIQS